MNQLNDTDFGQKIIELIDSLKGICASYGLGNDGEEYQNIGANAKPLQFNDLYLY